MSRRKTPEEVEWLTENTPKYDTHEEVIQAFERKFGWRMTLQSQRVWANRHGLHVRNNRHFGRSRCVRKVRWSTEPEMTEWMLENDNGRPAKVVSAEFEERFGFPLTGSQVTLFRQLHGKVTRSNCGGRDWNKVGVGAVRTYPDGRSVVKVREKSSRPGAKDNWVPLHVHLWEQANGPLPDGYVVVHADRDASNNDADNLVAVPKSMVARLNSIGYAGPDSLSAAVMHAMLESRIHELGMSPRRCAVCGEEFVPRYDGRTRTCPSCVDSGARPKPVMRGSAGTSECVVCGAVFERDKKSQRRCRACISKARKLSPDRHAEIERKRR